jgi:signal transduction histidine kinase
MTFSDMPIRRKLTLIILITSLTAMLLLSGTFLAYEFIAFRGSLKHQLATVGEITAANSTAALAFDDPSDANEILAALKAERHVVAACLYGKSGQIFARYPKDVPASALPAEPEPDGYRFEGPFIVGFAPVAQGGNDRLGTLFIRYDTGPVMAEWLQTSLESGLAVMALVLLVAYLMSRSLQRQVSQPILDLAETAAAVSARHDYSVRAKNLGGGEIGVLTDAFNQMLAQIQELNRELEQRVADRTAQLQAVNEDLARSRAELNNLFESLPGLYVVLTPDLRIVAASDAYLKATMTTREAITGRGLFEVLPGNPDDPGATGEANMRASLERVRRLGVPDTMAIQKYDVRRPDGRFEEHYWSPINSPVLGVDRKVHYIIHRVEDVTDFVKKKSASTGNRADLEVRMEQMEAEIYQSTLKVQESNRQLEAANKELEAFSYSVSHDLRAPLRHIDGFAGLLAKNATASLDENGRRYLATISAAAKRMGRLIDDLLSFSRTGRSELNHTLVDQDALVAAVLREGRFERGERPIEWNIAPLQPVRADAAMLRQVWSNLLENAVKYSGKAEHSRVEIGATADAKTGDHVFYVRDNGVGFDMQYVDKLFGVFQRLHSVSEFEGTGIGLANVRRIIARHGGRTWAEGALGKGATFYFSLPKARIAGDRNDTTVPAPGS